MKARHTFIRAERWASILAVVVIAVMFIYVTVLFAESVRAKSQQCSSQEYDVNGSIQRYLNQVQPARYSTAALDKQLGLLYFCDTGEALDNTLAVKSPLWDGSGCDQTYSCCSYKNPPWFYKWLLSHL